MVRTVQLQQAEKHGEIRTAGTAGVRLDQDRRARGAVPRGERLAVVHGGTNDRGDRVALSTSNRTRCV